MTFEDNNFEITSAIPRAAAVPMDKVNGESVHGVGGGHRDVDYQARKDARHDTARYRTCGGHRRDDAGFAFAGGLFPS